MKITKQMLSTIRYNMNKVRQAKSILHGIKKGDIIRVKYSHMLEPDVNFRIKEGEVIQVTDSIIAIRCASRVESINFFDLLCGEAKILSVR